MTERDPVTTFEVRLAEALRHYAADAPTEVEPYEVLHALASRRALRRAGHWPWASGLSPAVAWLLLLAALGTLAATITVGASLLRELTVLPSPSGESPVAPTAAASLPPVGMVGAGEIRDLTLAPDGTIWAITWHGVAQWDPSTGMGTAYGQADGLLSSEVTQLAIGTDGTVWVGGFGWLARFDGSWTPFTDLDGQQVSELGAVAIGGDGSLWAVSTNSATLLHHDGVWQAIPVPGQPASSPWADSLDVSSDGVVWASTGTGLLSYDGSEWTRYTKESTGLPGIPATPAIAPDGTVWVSAEPAHGVARFDGIRWTVFTASDGLASDEAFPVVGPDGSVWARSHDGGQVSRFDGVRWTALDLHEPVWEFAIATDGSLWFATSAGVARFDGRDVSHLAVPNMPATLPPISLVSDGAAEVTATRFGDITWRRFAVGANSAHWLASLTATPYGLAALDGPDLRWSADGMTWEGTALSIRAMGITRDGDELIAHGSGAVRLAWDGERWAEADRLEIEGLSDDISRIAVGPSVVVMAAGSDLFFSTDGHRFERSESPPDEDAVAAGAASSRPPASPGCGSNGWSLGHVTALIATPDGFVALTSGHPDNWDSGPLCDPVAWTSPDGRTWTLRPSESPFGDHAYILQVVAGSGRFVAVGGPPARTMWISNDALAWERVADAPASTVAEGELGWLILDGVGGGRMSADGLAWEQLAVPLPEASAWFSPAAAVGGHMVAAINFEILLVGTLER